ncbi:serine/threonine-protein kinase [Zavarzinella formosa]|uniref:serine/threonine-protein kinase n=1 Tax=Zavarzinella formosa TaxID=360055 RepID=UPI000373653E|nr:serine/threonine-protein kinase [Zavarzinella formosa]
MTETISGSTPALLTLDERIEAFENSGLSGRDSLRAFLPEQSDPIYWEVLAELIRVDMDRRNSSGAMVRVSEYLGVYPELVRHPNEYGNTLYEEYRLRLDRGEKGLEKEYLRLHGIRITDDHWERASQVPATPELSVLMTNQEELVKVHEKPKIEGFPEIGDEYLGFKVVGELGRGAFGRVFLAEELKLGGRHVALKVTAKIDREAERLAKLQHTNIVPVYSVHQMPPYQAVCMGFFGRETLADVLRNVRGGGSLPLTGGGLFTTVMVAAGSTINDHTRKTVADPAKKPDSALVGELPEDEHSDGRPQPIRRMLSGLGYVDAVVWMISRIAEGLAHAHDRGIIHRDLKPANILIGDDGQPMLLDFNLAVETAEVGKAAAGGTFPYMAPEQLEVMCGGAKNSVDHRSDLFSIGVLFCELLTGKHPYRVVLRKDLNIASMIDERRQFPYIREINPLVSHGVVAIVRRLLAFDQTNRYQSARELVIDLENHLANRPLKYAKEASFSEVARKWVRRNPRGIPVASCVLAVLACVGLGLAYSRSLDREQTRKAIEAHAAFTADFAPLRIGLVNPEDTKIREESRQKALGLLDRYQALNQADWHLQKTLRKLPEANRHELNEQIAELMILLAKDCALRLDEAPENNREPLAEEILRYHELAISLRFSKNLPAASWPDHARAAEILGREADVLVAKEKLAAHAEAARGDAYLNGTTELTAGRYAAGLALLDEAIRENPGDAAAHLSVAHAANVTKDLSRALVHYQIAQALLPNDPMPSFHRGRIFIVRKDYPKALEEFTKAITKDPTHGESYFHRALVKRRLGDLPAAIKDLHKAEELNASPVRVLWFRAQCHQENNQPELAKADREKAAAIPPESEGDFLARAASRVPKDIPGAVEDLNEALKINSRSIVALHNLAHIHSEHLQLSEQAIEYLDRALQICPELGETRAGKAVLLARIGKREKAHKEIERAMLIAGDENQHIMAASVYSLTARPDNKDAAKALECLRNGIRAGFRRIGDLETDTDLEMVRKTPDFKALIAATRELNQEFSE